MDIADQPLTDDEIGPQIAVGRDNTIFAVGTDRVLRRAPDRRSFIAEARAMEELAAHGYPVPRVHRVSPGEMVLERVSGPTMLDDLGRRPWRLGTHARTLADLHHRLHCIPATEDLRDAPVPGSVVVHLDLHPQNVILSPAGPVVIDWTNVARGTGPVDVAMTWIIIAVSDIDDPGPLGPLLTLFRRRFVARFLASAGRDEARDVLISQNGAGVNAVVWGPWRRDRELGRGRVSGAGGLAVAAGVGGLLRGCLLGQLPGSPVLLISSPGVSRLARSAWSDSARSSGLNQTSGIALAGSQSTSRAR